MDPTPRPQVSQEQEILGSFPPVFIPCNLIQYVHSVNICWLKMNHKASSQGPHKQRQQKKEQGTVDVAYSRPWVPTTVIIKKK